MKRIKINYRLFFLSLIPLGYILDGLFPDWFEFTLLIYIILYVFLFKDLLINKKSIKFQKMDILFYLWTLILFAGLLHSPFQLSGLFKTLRFVFLALGLITFTRSFIRKHSDIERLFKYLFYNSVIAGYIVLVDFIMSGSEVSRYMAFGDINPIPLSMLGATTILLAIILFYFAKITLTRFIISLAPSVAMISIAASKGPVVSLLATITLLSPIFVKKINIKVIIFSVISFSFLIRLDFIKSSYKNLIFRFSNLNSDLSTSIRVDGYEGALSMFLESPILGKGTGANYPHYPHNIFLEVLSENGLLLFLLVLIISAVFTMYYLLFLFKKRGTSYVEVMALALIICSLVSLQFSFSYVDHKYLFLGIGIYLAFKQLPVEQTETQDVFKKKKTKTFKRYKLVW